MAVTVTTVITVTPLDRSIQGIINVLQDAIAAGVPKTALLSIPSPFTITVDGATFAKAINTLNQDAVVN